MKCITTTFNHYFRFLLLGCLAAGFGCANNTHLRSQKVLAPGEKVFTGSASLTAGGGSDDFLYYSGEDKLEFTGVSGSREEPGMLTGTKEGEGGFYLGYGLMSDYILGVDIKRYVTFGKSSPWKLGLQAELNHNPRVSFEHSRGTTLHLRPSLTRTTSRNRMVYGGIHGLLAFGQLSDQVRWENEVLVQDPYGYDYRSWEYHEKMIDYHYSNFGGGLTWGMEVFAPDHVAAGPAPKVMDPDIVALAKSHAKRDFNGTPWGVCGGPASCGAMGPAPWVRWWPIFRGLRLLINTTGLKTRS